jgi:hypothetical protein
LPRAWAPRNPSMAASATWKMLSRSEMGHDLQAAWPLLLLHQPCLSSWRIWFRCFCELQIYVVYLGQLPSSENPSEPEKLSTDIVEAAHHDLLNEVLDDGRSSTHLLPHN